MSASADPAQVLVRRRRTGGVARRALLGAAGLLAVVAVWEVYKALGPDDGVVVGGLRILPRTDDVAMPHVADMLTRLLEPTTRAAGAEPLWLTVARAALFSLGVAAVGWVLGVGVGLALALLMQRFRLALSAVLPWVVLSQTVPLIALAPVVRGWGSRIAIGGMAWQPWMSVAVIASYLAFFPVAVGALRGLQSPGRAQTDLMRSYAATWWQETRMLRFPASVPYLLPALRLAAANAIIGTVVAEVSIGLRGGIGRSILEFAQSASGDPAKSWAPILGAMLLGLVAAGGVVLLGAALTRYRRGEAPS
ncbi:binding-protein-dependent transport systems inner membrane component [Beutenbergia cavernae DSM 12333]|uniref:Binding-protein-dependent transport systems inner membrane component n=1 Tax=Beutenbergia cavernae (strain ATCC BAA-8 / DSM 12333 / CCUG 43141 / JCM 11478 / NBRC 16432 / NCIMB 13614 / HKI 0122) TaxID=471853 RepID=C5BXD8_BEUC1|nr:ABC transporter permease subunit [Beutenbergia cavernae]ACQ80821.1 binding-protein-dependent transport systems inner membrane component [Beutenbergia cavernae DSM 12333]